jgi:hypothetical protein
LEVENGGLNVLRGMEIYEDRGDEGEDLYLDQMKLK